MNALTFKWVGFTIVALLSCVVDDVWSQVQYTVTDLGRLPGGGYSFANAINDSGQVVGLALDNTGNNHAFLYDRGVMRDLGLPPGGVNGYANAINNRGQIVIPSLLNNNEGHAFLYSGGTFQDLGPFPVGRNGAPYDINESGQIVGEFSPSTGDYAHAFLYSSGTMQDLGTLGGTMSEAHGINNSGQIVGHSRISSGYEHAFLYSGGTMQDLGTLPGCVSSNAYDINSTGQVVGDSQDSSGHFHAFLYSNGMMQDLGSLSGYTNSPAYAINDNGVVVGGVWKDHDITGASSLAVLFVDGKLIDLNSLTVPSSGWDLLSANAINSKGQIVGVGINPSGQKDAFLLTPTSTPEPSTLALLGTGALSLLACEWRRRRGA